MQGRRKGKHVYDRVLLDGIDIVDLEYLSGEFQGFDIGSRQSRMDLRVKTNAGTEVESLPKEEKRQYYSYMTTERDIRNQIDFAVEQGKATIPGAF